MSSSLATCICLCILLMLCVTIFVYQANTTTCVTPQCTLSSEDKKSLLDSTGKVWTLKDGDLEEHSLQDVINCAERDDVIQLQTSTAIAPQLTIMVPRRITIKATRNAEQNITQPTITCPPGQSLFRIYGEGATLIGIVIANCSFKKKDNVPGIIDVQVDRCGKNKHEGAANLVNVEFRNNVNHGGSVGIVVSDDQCRPVNLESVRFEGNRFSLPVTFSCTTKLVNVTIRKNKFIGDGSDTGAFFLFPPGSENTVSGMKAFLNRGVVIAVKDGALVLTRSAFRNNTAREEGVILAVNSEVSISDTVFAMNKGQKNGGALLSRNPTRLVIRRSIFLRNKADSGAAICINSGQTLQNQRSHTTSKRPASQSDAAKASRAPRAVIDISQCLFSKNYADESGSSLAVFDWSGRMTISDSIFKRHGEWGSEGREASGPMHFMECKNITVQILHVSFLDNHAEYHGGITMVDTVGTIYVNSSIFQNNTFQAYDGGAIYVTHTSRIPETAEAKLFLTDTLFRQNKAWMGGAMHLDSKIVQVEALRCSFVDNEGSSSGGVGGIIHAYRLIIRDSILSGNKAETKGGAFVVKKDAWFITFLDSNFTRNTAGQGGALFLERRGVVRNCRFQDNFAEENGGAVFVKLGTDVNLDKSLFVNNRAKRGGALYTAADARIRTTDSYYRGNKALLHGGAIAMSVDESFGLHRIQDCVFERNNATLGGAAYVGVDSTLLKTIDRQIDWWNPVFRRNHATRAGGAIFTDSLAAMHFSVKTGETSYAWSDRRYIGMQNNSVGVDGYGRNVATIATHYVVKICYPGGGVIRARSGSVVELPVLKRGKPFPEIRVVMLDLFGHKPALSKLPNKVIVPKDGVILEGYSDYVRGTLTSPDGFLSNSLTTDLRNGTGNFILERPLLRSGRYTLVVQVDGDVSQNVILQLTVRSCAIDEESLLNGTYCRPCGPDHYIFEADVEARCKVCPKDANCSTRYVTPLAGHWNAFPCATAIDRCIQPAACLGVELEFQQRLLKLSESCNITDHAIAAYQSAQCAAGYEAAICGSCGNSSGRFAEVFCYRCQSFLASILLLVLALLPILVLSCTMIDSSLKTTQELLRKFVYAEERLPIENDDGGTSDDSESVSTERVFITDHSTNHVGMASIGDQADVEFMNLLKILVNFLQASSLALSIDVVWPVSLSRMFIVWDFLGGAATQPLRFALDCLLPVNSYLPRTMLRQIATSAIPFVLVLGICVFWYFQRSRARVPAETAWRRCLLSLSVVVYVSYISLARSALNHFYCVNIHDDTSIAESESVNWYWILDTSMQCPVGYHSRYFLLVGVPLLILILLIPAALAALLLVKRRRGTLDDPGTLFVLSWLFNGYEDKYIYWDAMIMLRKAVLFSVVVFHYTVGVNLQGMVCLFVLSFSAFLQSMLNPFKKNLAFLNWLESLSITCTSFSFLTAIILKEEVVQWPQKLLAIGSCLAFNIGFFAIVVYYVFENQRNRSKN